MTATKWRRERLPTRAARRAAGASPAPAWYLIVLAAVGVLAAVLGILQIGSPTSSARTAKEIVTAERGIVQSTVTGSGDVEPAVDDSVSFQTSGTLQHLYVKQGDHVVKGQLLATLDPSSAQDTVDQAEQELTAAKDSLGAAESASSSSTTDSSTAVDRSDDASFVSYSPTGTTSTTSTTSTTTTASSQTSTTTTPTVSNTTPSDPTTTSPTTTVTVTAPSTATTPSSGTGSERSGSGSGASTGSDRRSGLRQRLGFRQRVRQRQRRGRADDDLQPRHARRQHRLGSGPGRQRRGDVEDRRDSAGADEAVRAGDRHGRERRGRLARRHGLGVQHFQ